ncbi:MAG: hypothetical protein AB1420_00885 [Bacillota bacterium]
MKYTLSTREKILLSILGMMTMVFMLFKLFAVWIYPDLIDIKKELRIKEGLLNNLENTLFDLDLVNAQCDMIKEEIVELEKKYIISTNDCAELIMALASLQHELSGLNVISVLPQEQTVFYDYYINPILINVSGDYLSIIELLNILPGEIPGKLSSLILETNTDGDNVHGEIIYHIISSVELNKPLAEKSYQEYIHQRENPFNIPDDLKYLYTKKDNFVDNHPENPEKNDTIELDVHNEIYDQINPYMFPKRD